MKKSICIIGFGRLGKTLADILCINFDVAICEVDTTKANDAATLGFPLITAPALAHYTTIIVCVPISQFEATIENVASHLQPGTLIMDTCSVKIMPVQAMERLLDKSIAIIATHPLFGPDSVRKGFNELTMVTCPIRVDINVYQEWNSYWKALGLNLVETTPDIHDKITAYTLGMPHFFGRIMEALELTPQLLPTVSYNALYQVMQQTRSDTWQLFHDMQHYNPYAKGMRERVYAAITLVEAKLDNAIND
jgi:prephenate dehydrogenase